MLSISRRAFMAGSAALGFSGASFAQAAPQHYYQTLDAPHFDYQIWGLSGVGPFRGPALDPGRPFIAFVGAAQTFGRFCAKPFPFRVARALETQALNLGVGGAGPRYFDTPAYLDWMNRASLVVMQVMSGRSEGNSFFDNSSTGNHLGIRLSDGKRMRYEEFLAELEAAGDFATRDQAIRESRQNLVNRYATLFGKITVPKVLLWLSERAPGRDTDSMVFPHFVNRADVRQIKQSTDAYVECVTNIGLPQTLWRATESIDGAWVRDGRLINSYYPSPEMHREAARLLIPVCRRFIA